jgi:hypothetical protein
MSDILVKYNINGNNNNFSFFTFHFSFINIPDKTLSQIVIELNNNKKEEN